MPISVIKSSVAVFYPHIWRTAMPSMPLHYGQIYFAFGKTSQGRMVLMLLPRPLTDEEQEAMSCVHKDVDGDNAEVASFEIKYFTFEFFSAIALVPNDPRASDKTLEVMLRHTAAVMMLEYIPAAMPTEPYFLTPEFILGGPEDEVEMMWKTLN